MTAPWYTPGLRFSCKPECGGACCKGGGFVFVTEAECAILAAQVGMNFDEFLERRTLFLDGIRSLATKLDGDKDDFACVFLDDGRCSVYEARPQQCRSYPFWPAVVESPEAWSREAERRCPGMNEGELITEEQITSRLKVMKGR